MIKTSESIAKIASALAKAQGAMRAALKDSVNPHFRSRYADLAGVWDVAREPLSANGLAVVQSPGEVGDKTIVLSTLLVHESGEWMEGQLTIPVSKPDAQGVGSAITYARRYALAAIVGIVQDDDDGNAASGPAPKKAAAPAPKKQTQEAVDDVPMEHPFNLDLALQVIEQAQGIDELKAVYTDAYNAADALGDDASIEALVKAKDARKEALSKKQGTPSRVKAAMQKLKTTPPPESAPAPAPVADAPQEENTEEGPF